MTEDEIGDRVRRVIGGCLGVERDRVTEDAHLLIDLRADSLARVEIFMDLEAAFGLELADEDGEAMQTVADAIRVVTAALAAGSPEPRP